MDKTKEIWENFVINKGAKYHFLARPRRFGKSLICSTIAELFQGNADMFKELFIYDKWDFEAEKCPVIYITMDLFPSESAKSFAIQISEFLHDIALEHEISLNSVSDEVHVLLRNLIIKLHRKYGKKVVVIVDEYDAPLHNFLNRPEELEVVRDELANLYGVLKPLEDDLRLVYLTGTSKFSNLSMFSKLNNIQDHTFNLKLNNICGYTREELESNFEDHLHHFATKSMMSYDELMAELTTQFNGYRFAVGTPGDGLPPTVFNPFDINQALDAYTFEDNKWIESGHNSGQLVSLILKNRASGKALENTAISLRKLQSITSTPSELLSYQCLMYYAGYTSIRSYDRETDMVTLAPPNDSIGRNVMKAIAETIFKAEVDSGDVELARKLINEIFATKHDDVVQQAQEVEWVLNKVMFLFPWQLLEDNEALLESTYNVMFSSFLRLGCLGHTYLGNEISCRAGGLGCAIETKDRSVVAIFEFKRFHNSTLVVAMMNQMKDKGLFADYFSNQTVIHVAVNIKEDRKVEVLIERSAGH